MQLILKRLFDCLIGNSGNLAHARVASLPLSTPPPSVLIVEVEPVTLSFKFRAVTLDDDHHPMITGNYLIMHKVYNVSHLLNKPIYIPSCGWCNNISAKVGGKRGRKLILYN